MSNAACTDSCTFSIRREPGHGDVTGRGAESGERGRVPDRPPDRRVAREARAPTRATATIGERALRRTERRQAGDDAETDADRLRQRRLRSPPAEGRRRGGRGGARADVLAPASAARGRRVHRERTAAAPRGRRRLSWSRPTRPPAVPATASQKPAGAAAGAGERLTVLLTQSAAAHAMPTPIATASARDRGPAPTRGRRRTRGGLAPTRRAPRPGCSPARDRSTRDWRRRTAR